jgi:sortase A
VVALYPLLTDFYAWYQQSQMSRQYHVAINTDNSVAAAPGGDESPAIDPELVWAMLEIPDIDVESPVVKGTSQELLAKAPGWYTETALPGEGNTAIAGHRTMYGATFRNLAKLKPGSTITLIYDQRTYRYRVQEVALISSNDWSVIRDVGYPALTLTTCTGNDEKRLAVRARMVPEE